MTSNLAAFDILTATRLRVAIYARVSTVRQVEADLSVPDQLARCRRYAAERHWDVAGTFVERGMSGTDENRPEMTKMLDEALVRSGPFDVILVHSFSRLTRDMVHLEMTVRKLSKYSVQLVAVTQELPNDSSGQLVRQVIGMMDEHFSRENAKHTTRSMKANAELGYWNGSRAPFGYTAETACLQGHREKKKLVVFEEEAEVVRRIFDLADGVEGLARGVKSIAFGLNENGQLHRGKKFSNSNVHDILTRTAYKGKHFWNKTDTKNKVPRPPSEWIAFDVISLVSEEQFDRVQSSLKARSPKVTAPRIVNGPTLLSAVARCGTCGCGLTISTGKSGQYRYYSCSGRANKGSSACPGRRIPQEMLDNYILDHVFENLLSVPRLTEILKSFLAQSDETGDARREKLSTLRAARTVAEAGVRNMLTSIEKGMFDFSDPYLSEHLVRLKSQIQSKTEQISLLEQTRVEAPGEITPDRIANLSLSVKDALRNGEAILRRTYLGMFIQRIDVGDDEITLCGSKHTLARAASLGGDFRSLGIVPSFVRNWRPIPDSGSDVNFDNGGCQVSYDRVPAIEQSRTGDQVRICLVSVPPDSPRGDNRGYTYQTTNLRTRQSWTLPNAEHMCGGA